MNEAKRICRTNFKYMYWSSVQQLVHHAFERLRDECRRPPGQRHDQRPGETPARQPAGNQLERHRADELAPAVTRSFLEDGDSLVMRGWCQGNGYRVGFGEVEGTIMPAE